MDVEKNLNVVLLGGVEEPGDLVLCTISAADIGSVLLEGPVTDRNTDHFDLTVCHLLEGILGNPSIPMVTEHGVTFFRAKSLTESVLVHTDAFLMGLTKEAVEHGRSDPWLKDHPATNVGANHGSAIRIGCSSESGGCESSGNERLHNLKIIKICLELV